MLIEEITAKLAEIDADTALPLKSEGEVDAKYVEQMYPGLIAGVTNFILNEDGTRNVANIKALTKAGYHSFATNRNVDAKIPSGRVRTTKGVIIVH